MKEVQIHILGIAGEERLIFFFFKAHCSQNNNTIVMENRSVVSEDWRLECVCTSQDSPEKWDQQEISILRH